jgi:hypothetical protein
MRTQLSRLSKNDPDAVGRMKTAGQHLERAFAHLGHRASVEQLQDWRHEEAERATGFVRITLESPALESRIADTFAGR